MAILKVGEGARTGENATPASGPGFSYMANGMVVTGDIQEIGLRRSTRQRESPGRRKTDRGAAHRNLRMCVATATTSPCWLVAVTVAVVVARDASAATIS